MMIIIDDNEMKLFCNFFFSLSILIRNEFSDVILALDAQIIIKHSLIIIIILRSIFLIAVNNYFESFYSMNLNFLYFNGLNWLQNVISICFGGRTLATYFNNINYELSLS